MNRNHLSLIIGGGETDPRDDPRDDLRDALIERLGIDRISVLVPPLGLTEEELGEWFVAELMRRDPNLVRLDDLDGDV